MRVAKGKWLAVCSIGFATIAGCGNSEPRVRAALGTRIWSEVEFGGSTPPYQLSHDGVKAVVVVPPPQSEHGRAVTTIEAPGFQPLTVHERLEGGQYPRQIGIGKLAASDPVPSVLLQMYTGGAHCCALITAIVPVGATLRAVELPTADGEGLKAFPADWDGDGVVDFVGYDDRFLHEFSSYARSSPPPQILNIQGGKVVDVSAGASFAPMFEEAAVRAKAKCSDKTNSDRNGACASYVASAARLGRYHQAAEEAADLAYRGPGLNLPTRCTVALIDYSCPEGREIEFKSFPDALEWFLQENGYIAR